MTNAEAWQAELSLLSKRESATWNERERANGPGDSAPPERFVFGEKHKTGSDEIERLPDAPPKRFSGYRLPFGLSLITSTFASRFASLSQVSITESSDITYVA